MVALFIKGSIKWVKDSIADILIAAGTATRVTGTKLTSAAADAARANPITKASQLPKSVIDATKKANTPKPAAAKKPGGGADRSEAGKRAWATRRKNPPSEVSAKRTANAKKKKDAADARREARKEEAAQAAIRDAGKPPAPPKLTKEQRSAKLKAQNAARRTEENMQRLKDMGIDWPYDKTNPVHVRKYAKFMRNKEAAEKASSRKMGDALQIQGPRRRTPASQKGMAFAGRGEPTGRKSGGKVSAKKYAYGGRVAKYKG